MKVRDLAQRIDPGQPAGKQVRDKGLPSAPEGDRLAFARELARLKEKPDLKLSAHAELRVAQRNIQMGSEERGQIADALLLLEEKGARDALLMRADVAFIVNVPSRTVVTALDRQEIQARVFTNIDSAVFL